MTNPEKPFIRCHEAMKSMSKQSLEVKRRSTDTTEAEAWQSCVREWWVPCSTEPRTPDAGQESCWDPKSYQCASQRRPTRLFHHSEGSSGQKRVCQQDVLSHQPHKTRQHLGKLPAPCHCHFYGTAPGDLAGLRLLP